jgi:hypothetical protein
MSGKEKKKSKSKSEKSDKKDKPDKKEKSEKKEKEDKKAPKSSSKDAKKTSKKKSSKDTEKATGKVNITMTVLEGRSLAPTGWTGGATTHVMVTVFHGGLDTTDETPAADSTEPTWDHSVSFPGIEQMTGISVYLKNSDNQETQGVINIPSNLVTPDENGDYSSAVDWFELERDDSMGDDARGEIHLSLSIEAEKVAAKPDKKSSGKGEKGEKGSASSSSKGGKGEPPANANANLLKVEVIQARGLKAVDFSLMGLGSSSSDPFCRVSCSGQSNETAVKEANLEPVFNEVFEYHATDEDEELCVVLLDKDRLSETFLGQVKIPLSSMQDIGVEREWHPLRGEQVGLYETL